VLEKLRSFFNKDDTKTVYRFVNYGELDLLKNNIKQGLGSSYNDLSSMPNKHKYEVGENYLHFFDNLKDAYVVLPDLCKDKSFICSFDIKKSLLREHASEGYYTPHGYDYDYITVKEYAIPVSQLDIEQSFKGYAPIEHLTFGSTQKEIPFASTKPEENAFTAIKHSSSSSIQQENSPVLTKITEQNDTVIANTAPTITDSEILSAPPQNTETAQEDTTPQTNITNEQLQIKIEPTNNIGFNIEQ